MGQTLESLTARWSAADTERCRAAANRAAFRADNLSLCVVDDDPTGTQTVQDVPVCLRWDEATLRDMAGEPVFFVSANTRALPPAEAASVYEEIGAGLRAAFGSGMERLRVVSRSDSTLRGHFPLDVESLQRGLGFLADGVIVAPALFEAGRYTIGGVHYAGRPDCLVEAHRTEFARDPDFGFRHSLLPDWVEEKTGGMIRAEQVSVIGLDLLRAKDDTPLMQLLAEAGDGRVYASDAACYGDLDRFVAALHETERRGKRFLYRTAASFVKARAGLADHPLLEPGQVCEPGCPGMVVAGSYVEKTTRQLDELLRCKDTVCVELDAESLLDTRRDTALLDAAKQVAAALEKGITPVLHTSRHRLAHATGQLAAGEAIMSGLCAVVARLRHSPGFLISKGGITSHEVAQLGLGIARARVLGQIAAGVPVWIPGPESRFPGLAYVVFPGNVGDDNTLARVFERLRTGKQGGPQNG